MDIGELDQVTATGIDLAMRFGPKLLVCILILVAGWFAGRWASRSTVRATARFHLEPPVQSLLGRIAGMARPGGQDEPQTGPRRDVLSRFGPARGPQGADYRRRLRNGARCGDRVCA